MQTLPLFDPCDSRDFLRRIAIDELPPLVISAALTGSLQGKEANASLPETPEEQAEEARRCYEAGASSVHIHARDPMTGYATPARRAEDFVRVNRAVRSKCADIIINNTSGGGQGLSLEERLCSLDANPEVSDIDMGPFAVRLKLKKRQPPLSGRDEDELLDGVAAFTIGEMEERARRMLQRGIRAEMALFHSGHWSTAYNLIDKKLVTGPYIFNFLFGLQTGALPTAASLIEMLQHLPRPAFVTVGAIGKYENVMTALAIALGLNVTVGLENNLHGPFGQKYDSNARAVERVARLSVELGRKLASPSEARALMGLSEQPTNYPE